MAKYRLVISVEADQDLDTLYEEGFNKWGEAQADRYYDELLKHFDALCDNPYLFRAVDEIRKGYRRSVCGRHSVFCQKIEKVVLFDARCFDNHFFTVSCVPWRLRQRAFHGKKNGWKHWVSYWLLCQ